MDGQTLVGFLNHHALLGKLCSIVIGIVILLILEGGLRLSNFGSQFDFILKGSNTNTPLKYSLNTQYIALHYFSHLKVDLEKIFTTSPWFPDTVFLQKKKQSFRIFSLGASTTRGFPFTKRTISYSGFLGNILADVIPDKKVEIINAGYDALSSFAVLDIFKKTIKYDPDLIIVYTGHNEFIGHFGTSSTVNIGKNRLLIESIISLQNSKLFLLNKLAFFKINSFFRKKSTAPVNLFQTMLRKSKVTWTESDHELTEKNYRLNLTEMANLAQKNGIRLIFSSLTSNLSDFSPIKPEFDNSTSIQSQKKIRSLLSKGISFMNENKTEEAIQTNKKALELDINFAESHYNLGKAYETASNYELAQSHFELARDFDKLHLRSCTKLNNIIEEVGKKFNVPVVDMEKSIRTYNKNKPLGNNFFLEHVHPNINGHLVMGETIARFLFRHDILGAKKLWYWSHMRSAREYVVNSGFDRKQFENGRYTAGRLLLDFPFYKCEEGVQLLQQAKKLKFEKTLIQSCKTFRKN